MIDFINASYGNSLDSIDMTPYLFNGNTSAGGYPVGLALTPEESLKWAAEIYSPENWETSLKYIFTQPARHAVAPSEPQDQPVRVPRGGTERQDGPQQ